MRLEYAGIHCQRADTPLEAIGACEPGPVELLANYTAFRDLRRVLGRREQTRMGGDAHGEGVRGTTGAEEER